MEISTLYLKKLRGMLERSVGDDLKRHLMRYDSALSNINLNSVSGGSFESQYNELASAIDRFVNKRDMKLKESESNLSKPQAIYIINRMCAMVDLYAVSEGYDAESELIASKIKSDFLVQYLKDVESRL
ncbi:MAG: hypothetical protein HWE07_06420 [Cytophagia bacterium]|nr:hypothetical protein [Cytophagia bacterium]